MQLLVLVLMLLMSGKNADIQQLKPIIEEFGGGKAADALKQAEELSDMVSAVQALASFPASPDTAPPQDSAQPAGEDNAECNMSGYPLAPIAGIADETIINCFSRYITLGE